MSSSRWGALAAAAVLAGCVGDGGTLTKTSDAGAGGASDTGGEAGAPAPADAGPGGGEPPDTGPPTDARPPGDDARAGDAGPDDDTGPPPDDAGPGPDAAVACEPGQMESAPCGLNGRGTRTRTCDANGVFLPWDACVDPDVCRDGDEEVSPCGLNGDGQARRLCEGGHWGELGPCEDPAECVDGAVEQRPCGLNGNGRESRACAGGAWGAYGACEGDPDECLEGSEVAEACGVNGNGTRLRLCRDGRLSEPGPCDDPDRACEDGAVEILPCGLNRRGTQSHTCVGDRFGPFTACDDPDECIDDAVHQEGCGLNGRGLQRQTCVEGAFGPFGPCDDPDECVDGTMVREACGLNGRGERTATCLGGRMGALSACNDPDECVDGAIELAPVPCGLNDRGEQRRTCDEGSWSPFSACQDPDECVDGTDDTQPCGAGGAGMRTRTCDDGHYGPFGECEGAAECPDPANPRCVPQVERCNGQDDDGDGEIDEGLSDDAPLPPETPFGEAVNAAIDRGLEYARVVEAGQGFISESNANFLAVLAFLERRQGNPWAGPLTGWEGLDADDQALVRRLLIRMIADDRALTMPGVAPYSYTTGGALMALSVYLDTGGPDDFGAAVTATQALANGVNNLVAVQGQPPANAWGYSAAGNDLSTTHFAASGLAAAAAVLDGADATLDRLPLYLDSRAQADGGQTYASAIANDTSSSSMTAAGFWAYRLGGAAAGAPGPQRTLGWLRDHYTYDRMVGGNFVGISTWYYFWAMIKAMAAAEEAPGGLSAADFGDRDPAALGYPEEEPSAYFDIAYSVIGWQDANGAWGSGFGGSPSGWTRGSTQGLALLTLMRSTGGVRQFGSVSRRPACNNGRDDDADGRIDFPLDPECSFACTRSERLRPACGNDLDDDADGWIDFPDDPGCTRLDDDTEADPACSNGRDDDADGRVDYPADPGCTSRIDAAEPDPAVLPACADRRDNDADGLVDFGSDPQCYAANQDEEGGELACPMGLLPEVLPAAGGVRGSNAGAPNLFRGTCGGVRGREVVYALVADRPQRVRLSTANDQTNFDTALYVLAACTPGAQELACNQDVSDQDPLSTVTVDLPTAGVYFVVVDAQIGEGDFELTVERTPRPAACGDGGDDDGDGLVDLLDDGCTGPDDGGEEDQPGPPICGNALDDDGDGFADFPLDPGCAGPGDDDETDPRPPVTCSDGRDNDADGATDWPADPSCAGAGADSEFAPAGACGNGRDDDGDDRADFPWDPGCDAPADRDEANPEETPACANGADDDRDGRIDFPADPGCASRADASEADPGAAPACANGRDDDGDGATDWPADATCCGAGAPSEGGADCLDPDEPAPPACFNGVDDDGDAAIDGADRGCTGAADDDDETDPGVVPGCRDARDNDNDRLTDWPADDGCDAAGDPCEQPGRVMCGNVCVDLDADAANCGRCGRACPVGVECIRGACGGIRPFVRACGNPQRPVTQFIRGRLAEEGVQVLAGCRPDADTQALVISRAGLPAVVADAPVVRAYIEDGGQVLTEYGISHSLYNALFAANVAQGPRRGNCSDAVQPLVQMTPADPLWQVTAFAPPGVGQDGCGYAIQAAQIPGFVRLGGWDANNVSLGYVEADLGRLWFIESDWQDNQNILPAGSLDLMAAMILGGR